MKKLSRRQFVKSTATVVAFSPSLFLASQSIVAADQQRVDPDDPQAKGLSYVHVSPNPDTICANCQLYGSAADTEWGPCPIFPGKLVAGGGWCSAWVKKTS